MKKKIIIGVSLGLVVAIIATVITLACVKRSYKPEIDLSPRIVIENVAEKTDYESGVAYSNKQEFEKFKDIFDKSFKQSILSSIFTGNSGNKIQIEPKGKTNPILSFKEGYTVTFDYGTERNLKLDGENYSYSDKEVVYKTIIFNIAEQEEGYNQISLYAKEQVGNISYYYEISTIANTYELYDFLSELDYK